MTDQSQINPLWHLVDILTVEQAAALIAGYDPSRVAICDMDNSDGELFQRGVVEKQFPNLAAARAALINSVNGNGLKATIRRDARLQGWDEFPNFGESMRALDEVEVTPDSNFNSGVIYCESPDWGQTTIKLVDLITWLLSRGVKTGFFFRDATEAPDYLDPKHPRYSLKLAAAVNAWQAVTDPAGKPPKQALLKWLRENAAKYSLTDDDGKTNETGIEEIAKVTNWLPGGGAPRTPGG